MTFRCSNFLRATAAPSRVQNRPDGYRPCMRLGLTSGVLSEQFAKGTLPCALSCCICGRIALATRVVSYHNIRAILSYPCCNRLPNARFRRDLQHAECTRDSSSSKSLLIVSRLRLNRARIDNVWMVRRKKGRNQGRVRGGDGCLSKVSGPQLTL